MLDIGLDGNAWAPVAPPADLSAAPAANPGVVRIRYENQGMYEVTFEDLEALGIEGYLEASDVDDLRLYYMDTEIGMEVVSADSSFSAMFSQLPCLGVW